MKNLYERKRLLYLILLLFFGFSVSAQEGDTLSVDSIIFQSPVNVQLFANATVRFQNDAMTYLSWKEVPDAVSYEVAYRSSDSENWITFSSFSNEITVGNLPLDQDFYWKIEPVLSGENNYTSDIGKFSTFQQTEPIAVSDNFYNKLIGWFGSEGEEVDFCDFLDEADINIVEKLSFVQVYFFENEPFYNAVGSEILSDWYAPMPPNLDGGCLPAFREGGGCGCHVFTRGNNMVSPGKKDYITGEIEPDFRQWIAKQSGPDKTYIDRFYAGAAKFVSLRQRERGGGMNFELSNLQGGSNNPGGVTTLASEVEFYLGCMDGTEFNTNLPEGCDCERPLTVDYEYTSRYHVLADTKSSISSSAAIAQAEDMTVVAATNLNTGEMISLAAGQFGVARTCDTGWNPGFWIQVLNVATPVVQFYIQTQGNTNPNQPVIPSQSQINQLIQSLQNLITTPFLNTDCNDPNAQVEQVLVSGIDRLTLTANNGIRVSMFNSYYLNTRGHNRYNAEAGIASDYFLIGVVNSEQTVDEQCCTDKFGAYLAGSLSVPPDGDVDVEAVNDIAKRKEYVGRTMTRYGDWDFYVTPLPGPGPDDGIIPVDFEFDLITGRDCRGYQENESDNFRMTGTGAQDAEVNSDNVLVYPSIITELLNVEVKCNEPDFAEIRILDLNGKTVQNLYSGKVEEGIRTFSFPLRKMPGGNYLVQVVTGKRNSTFKIMVL